METIEKLEIVKGGPYRFIGKSMYVRAGSSDEFCFFILGVNWIWEKLDKINEYATVDNSNACLVTWDKYDDKSELMGYTAGRFMKADTPVPEDMDYFDIPEGYIGKCIVRNGDAQKILKDEAQKQGYEAATHIWHAEIYPSHQQCLDIAALRHENLGDYSFGSYIPCNKKDN